MDGNIVRKSLELAAIAPGDRVVEIGPGLGTLTVALLAAGAHVFAIERDAVLARHLREWLSPLYPKTFHLLEGDAVHKPLAGLPDAVRAAGEAAFPDYKVVANLPYSISTPWMDALLVATTPLPACLVVMLQRETAERFAAAPGTGGKSVSAITIALDCAFERAPGHRVPPACFFPPPRVDSVLLHLVRKPQPRRLLPVTRQVLRMLFLHRRKQIGPLLRRLPLPALADVGNVWLDRLPEWGTTPQSRPETIPPQAWLALDDMLA